MYNIVTRIVNALYLMYLIECFAFARNSISMINFQETTKKKVEKDKTRGTGGEIESIVNEK